MAVNGWSLDETVLLQSLLAAAEPTVQQEMEMHALYKKGMAARTRTPLAENLTAALELAEVIKRDAPDLEPSHYGFIVALLASDRDRMMDTFMMLRALQRSSAAAATATAGA